MFYILNDKKPLLIDANKLYFNRFFKTVTKLPSIIWYVNNLYLFHLYKVTRQTAASCLVSTFLNSQDLEIAGNRYCKYSMVNLY